MDRDLFRGLHAQTHFVAANLHDDNRDVIVDDDAFVLLPRQHQHDDNPFLSWRRRDTAGLEIAGSGAKKRNSSARRARPAISTLLAFSSLWTAATSSQELPLR